MCYFCTHLHALHKSPCTILVSFHGNTHSNLSVGNTLSAVLTALILARDLTLISGAFYIRYVTLPPPVSPSRLLNNDITSSSPAHVVKVLGHPTCHCPSHTVTFGEGESVCCVCVATIMSSFKPHFFSLHMFSIPDDQLNTVLQLSLVGLSLGAPVLGYVDHPLLHMLG